MWRPPDKGRWGALGLGLLAAWFVLLCGWEPFLSLLLAAAVHELGHYLALRIQGVPVTGLRLSPWGAVMDCRRNVLSYGGELLALLAGPGANLALSAALCLAPRPPEALIGAGLVLGGFNLLPLRRLDGGEALRCALTFLLGPERGEGIAAAVSRLTAAHGAGLCAFVMLRSGGNLFLLPALALFLGECLGRRRSGGGMRGRPGKNACISHSDVISYQGVKGRSSALAGPKGRRRCRNCRARTPNI